MNSSDQLIKILSALEFASDKHKYQRRKGFTKIPYINHPIKVARILSEKVTNPSTELIIAAILHDVIEDTDTQPAEIKNLFGESVLNLVLEVSDDMSLTYNKRKALQIKKAPHLSSNAKLIKIADKLTNINDLLHYPINWSRIRKLRYIIWSDEVVKGCTGVNDALEHEFHLLVQKSRHLLQKKNKD